MLVIDIDIDVLGIFLLTYINRAGIYSIIASSTICIMF